MASRAQPPVQPQSTIIATTNELLAQLIAKIEAITIGQNMQKRKNENRMEEISKLAKNLGYLGEVVTDSPDKTEDENLRQKEEEKQIAVDN